ncbi:MAG: DUF177 domain-containing protein [Deltaproteobacteria bacterium]|nr:DUF177 domain-containing protein [Deltaproteobacteria bacterium]MBW1960600.1 DUF177 domain-containing protein [Deltaproteobacteria bacterium]MBW1994167.1 DUF177 domain-containing protein [Deltaproteobacteria bacterium]MBW2150903.1 DUF177 domain-containing protein [Deltaproteobacteria bacterium]
MLIKIKNITAEGLTVHFEESAKGFPVLLEMAESGECDFFSPVKTRAILHKAGELIEVEGIVETEVRLTCSRCLKKFRAPLTDRFSFTYTRKLPDSLEKPNTTEIELRAEDMGLILFEGDTIDFREAIQQQVVMMFPQRPLCNDLCKGLCPQCGADLNEGNCGCRRSTFNSKFAALKDLKIENK